jgi:hypothetical protein
MLRRGERRPEALVSISVKQEQETLTETAEYNKGEGVAKQKFQYASNHHKEASIKEICGADDV